MVFASKYWTGLLATWGLVASDSTWRRGKWWLVSPQFTSKRIQILTLRFSDVANLGHKCPANR